MKAVSVRNPWALLICKGIKDIENRSWPTKYRGRILIHAASTPAKFKFEQEGQATWQEIQIAKAINEADELDLYGRIIGSVEIVDCVKNHPSPWAMKDSYNWVLANERLFPEPVKALGNLSLWNFDAIDAKPEVEGGELFCHCSISVSEQSQVMSLITQFRCNYCEGIWYK